MDMQLTIDCNDPSRMVEFWTVALDYVPAPPPASFESWRDYYLSVGVPADELSDGDCTDRIIDPDGVGIRIWFQPVPETKAGKNRLHLDIYPGGGCSVERSLRRTAIQDRVAALVELGGSILKTYPDDFPEAPGTDDCAGDWFCTMADPEGNEFCVS